MARLAGLLYLVVGITGGFAEFTRAGIRVAGDPTATATNVRAGADMLRLAFAADLVDITCFVLAAFALYAVLNGTSKGAAAIFVVFNAIAVAVMAANLLPHAASLVLATDPTYATALGTATVDALALFFLDLHHIGYLVAQVFFGGWLMPLGYVVYRSGRLPRALGVALMLGCVGYLVDVAASVASPTFTTGLTTFVAFPAGLTEIAFAVWLAAKGAGPRGADSRVAAEGALAWNA